MSAEDQEESVESDQEVEKEQEEEHEEKEQTLLGRAVSFFRDALG